MAEPRRWKVGPVEGGRLYVAIEAVRVEVLCNDAEFLAIAQTKRRVGDAGRADEVDVLAGDGEDAERGEDEPTRHCTGVIVARDASAIVHEIFFEKQMNDVGALVGASSVVVEHRDEEAGFVGDIEVLSEEGPVEAVDEHLIAAGHLDEATHVLRGVDGVGPDVAFVEKVGPGAADDEIGRSPGAVRVAWTHKTLEAFDGHVLVPEVLEVVSAAGVERSFFFFAKAAGHLGDGEVVVAVLSGA